MSTRLNGVAVTGVGVVSPLGTDPDIFFNGLLECRSCLGPLSMFDSECGVVPTVAEFRGSLRGTDIRGFRPSRTDRLGILAARSAIRTTAADCSDLSESGVVIATTVGGLSEISSSLVSDPYRCYRSGGFGKLTSYQVSQPAELIGEDLGLRGPRFGICVACASGSMAIALGARMILDGTAPIMLVGGTEALCPFTLSGFNALQALDPAPCKPFDHDRKGLNLGEGAAVMVLEPLDQARARGATIWAVLLGWGMSNDAYHPTAPHKEGLGISESIEQAMKMAGAEPDEIDYVNAHGTGTRLNDGAEVRALEKAFRDRRRPIAVSSTKSYFGHCLGAAGALEALVTVLSLRHGVLPPTLRLRRPMESAMVDWITGEPRREFPRLAVTVSAGFGGSNTSLVFGLEDRE